MFKSYIARDAPLQRKASVKAQYPERHLQAIELYRTCSITLTDKMMPSSPIQCKDIPAVTVPNTCLLLKIWVCSSVKGKVGIVSGDSATNRTTV